MDIEMQTGLEKGYADEIIALVNDKGDSEVSEAYIRGYEDGYDQACMDLTDDDLGSSQEDQKPECGYMNEDDKPVYKKDCPWK